MWVATQVEGHPNKDALLESARRLRLEKDREQELANQKMEQEQAITRADQRLARLQAQLKDLRSASMGTTPEGERHQGHGRRGGERRTVTYRAEHGDFS